MKIAILGHPGSGKTHIANKLHKKLGVETIDIDILFDKHPAYFISPKLYRKAINRLLANKSDWIIDGYHGKRMPGWIWKSADIIIFADLPKDQLRKNVTERYRNAKKNDEFSHWQSTRANNLKNFAQIRFLDKSLRQNAERIQESTKAESEFIVLQSMTQVKEFLSNFHA